MSTALAMATICCTAREQEESSCFARAGMPRFVRISVARFSQFFQGISVPFVLPMNMFSATVRFGQRVIS